MNRLELEDVLSSLYDYEYIDLDKFYNDNYTGKLLLDFDLGDDNVIEELLESLQDFLDFETNYNCKLGDF